MLTTTATEMQNNFGKYLNSVIQGQEIIITKMVHQLQESFPNTKQFLI